MLLVVEIEESRRDYWDKEVVKFENAHPLNAFGWGKVRAVDGWKPTYLMAKSGSLVTGAVMLLTKRIPITGFSIMYAPRGPVYDVHDNETLKVLLNRIRIEARKSHAIFLRIDPNVTENALPKNGDPFVGEGFVHLKHRWTFWNTPRDVYRIDLAKTDTTDALFLSLDPAARRAVRKALKQGVTIKQAKSSSELDSFYKIFKEFSISKGFMSRNYQYQEVLWDEFIAGGNGALFLAIYQGKIIGGLICLIFGSKCLLMHMGTPYKYQHLRANDAYVWEAVKWAKESGCKWFSFRGVGTTPTQERFKRKFGPEVVSLVGYYDLPLCLGLYRLFHLSEFEILPRAWATLMKARHRLNYMARVLKGQST